MLANDERESDSDINVGYKNTSGVEGEKNTNNL